MSKTTLSSPASLAETGVSFPGEEVTTIRELIDRMAEIRGQSPFLVSPDTGKVLTFASLKQQSRSIAARLLELGLDRGDKVAFLLENGLFTAQLFLGTMYGGMVSVPLNPRAGVTQLTYTLKHCDAKAVFVEQQHSALATEALAGVDRAIQMIPADVDDFAEEIWTATGKQALPLPATQAEDPALVMYTSGSVGQPKGAVHSQRTILAHGMNSISSHQLTETDRSLLVLPLYHINAECVTLIPTLMSGGAVVVPHRFSVSQFWDWLEEYRCTWSAIVPTIVSQLLDWQDPRAADRQATFQRIRFLRSSSAPLSPSLHREFLDNYELHLIQAMGSSEAGNIFSNPQRPGENKIGSPGLAWGFETRIIDRDGADVPPGEPGEILIRGAAVMQGYYKDPQGTQAVLDSDGWFHTGDLAYQDQDGYFFVVGRSKELIIKAGVNIAPKQIDEVLESHPSVLEAAAVGIPDRYVGEDVVAFAVLRSGMAADENEMLTFCETRLGQFKTPTRIYFVPDLPKGPSGKVQRLRLVDKVPQAAEAASASATAQPAEVTGIEQTITEIWAEVLKTSEVNPESNFFSLGGHSLLAIQCLSRMRDKLPVALSLSDFFEYSTVAQQAALVRQRLLAAGSAQVSAEQSSPGWEQALQKQVNAPASEQPIQRRDPSPTYLLSPAQRRIWFFQELVPGVPLYNECEGIKLVGELNVGALEQALNVIIERHEILRSTIHAAKGEPVAVVHESWPLRVLRIDLTELPAAERETEVERLLVEEPRRPYHLENEPGIRATLIRTGAKEHVFILMMHHLVCDWGSEGILWRELSALYHALCRGESLALPPLPIQHGDFAVWQAKRDAEAGYGEDLNYWEENLRGAPDLLELPADRSRLPVQTYRGKRQRFRIGPELVAALRECSSRERNSLFTVFAAAFDVLLYRYTGTEDISLGIPLADRDRPEVQSVIGFLLHTHVLRAQLSGDITFRELLSRVRKAALDLYAHRSVPFDEVVTRMRPERNLAYSPLFQVMLNWRDREQQLEYIGMDGLKVESVLAESQTSKFDLTMMLTDGGDEIWLEAEYSTELFDDSRIARMFGHYQTILESVASDSAQRLSDLPILTAEEKQQLLVEWNRTELDFPQDAAIHKLFEAQAQRTPDQIAVEFYGNDGKTQLTYAELDQRSNRFAQYLRTLGVGPDTVVAIYIERSLDMVVGLLGILKAGGAYLPLDILFPHDRLEFMVADAQPKVLVTSKKLLGSLPANQSQIACVDDFRLEGEAPAAVPAHSRQLAYVLYTSGSTGKPKGVAVEHRQVVNFLASMRKAPGIDESDILLSVTTLSFDIFGLELWLPLTTGAKTVIVPSETAADGAKLAEVFYSSGATIMQATPLTWRILLASGWEGHSRLKILCGGEAWSQQLADELLPRCASLWNMYGPTETTIWSAISRIGSGEQVLIGPPIANTQLYVVDRQLQPVPVGVPGELLIGGDGLARGYLHRPELTQEKFIPDHLRPNAGARLYRTGDLVRYLPSRNIEFLGRIDLQVKIRGFRIELGEIENQLRQHELVREAVVMVRDQGEKQLVAFVVPAGPELPVAELRDYLKQRLPEYMVPASWVSMPALPTTANGKVDRKALQLSSAKAEVAHTVAYAAPGNEIEQKTAAIWQEVLGSVKVGRDDNFFDLGGNSLLLLRVHNRLQQTLNKAIPLVDMFRWPTVRAFAQHVGNGSKASTETLMSDEERKDGRQRRRQRRTGNLPVNS